jgi:hypothetical protein
MAQARRTFSAGSVEHRIWISATRNGPDALCMIK